MIWDWLAGNWKQLIGPMQEKWGKLNHLDLVVAAGEREPLIALLQNRYGYQRPRAEAELDEFARIQKARDDMKVEECLPILRPQ